MLLSGSISIVVVLLEMAAVVLAVLEEPSDPCASAPTEAAKIICRQLHKWDEKARAQASKKKTALPPGIAAAPPAELAPIASSIYQCMDLQCMCSYMRGTVAANGECTLPSGQILGKAIRKEIRMMTGDERRRYFAAIRTLKQNGEYDRIARIHSQSTESGGAHSGPAFLPWHREFTKRFEFALRQIDPTLALPYWDSTLDSALGRPTDSILFSPEMGGTTDGQGFVSSGPFTDWQTLEGSPNIKRSVGEKGSPMKESEIDFVMKQKDIDQVLAFSAPRQGCPYRTDYNCLEYTHGNVHIFVGGDMFDTSTSANDPLFFNHHAFVDLIWELWRQQRQSRADRETAYPPDYQVCASPQHFAAAQMNPFPPMRNIDGLSNKYTDNLYEYAPRPKCSQTNPSCGSKYLFCDLSHGQPRCSSTIRLGASCTGYTRGENPCYNAVCSRGRCTPTSSTFIDTPTFNVTVAPIDVAPQETCFNENQCCSGWAVRGECVANPRYMNIWCKASCGICRPHYRLADDCSDRHTNCKLWARSGECTANSLWMTENCRKSCGLCGRTRAQSCTQDRGGGANVATSGCGGNGGGSVIATTTASIISRIVSSSAGRGGARGGSRGGGSGCDNVGAVTTTTEKPEPVCNNNEGCYNEHVCCPHWSVFGECTKSPKWMSCNCRVSCGHCVPNNYNYGSCLDYHHECRGWARLGECEKNQWMLENCRASCRSCLSQWDLRQICRGPVGSDASLSKISRPSRRPVFMWEQTGWGQVGFDYDDWGMRWGNGEGGRGGRWVTAPPHFPPFVQWGWL